MCRVSAVSGIRASRPSASWRSPSSLLGHQQRGQGQHGRLVGRLQLEGLAQRRLVAGRDQPVDLGRRRDQAGDPLAHGRLGQGADEAVDDLAVPDGVHRRDGLHLEGRGHPGVGVDVDLDQLDRRSVSSTTFSRIGPSVRHGPHHDAHRSTTTVASVERSSTSVSKVASVTSMAIRILAG